MKVYDETIKKSVDVTSKDCPNFKCYSAKCYKKRNEINNSTDELYICSYRVDNSCPENPEYTDKYKNKILSKTKRNMCLLKVDFNLFNDDEKFLIVKYKQSLSNKLHAYLNDLIKKLK